MTMLSEQFDYVAQLQHVGASLVTFLSQQTSSEGRFDNHSTVVWAQHGLEILSDGSGAVEIGLPFLAPCAVAGAFLRALLEFLKISRHRSTDLQSGVAQDEALSLNRSAQSRSFD
jgi:hypothetical protein